MVNAIQILQRGKRRSRAATKSYVQILWVSPNITEIIWVYVRDKVPPDDMPKQLLWALLLLKVYNPESVNQAINGAHMETFIGWS